MPFLFRLATALLSLTLIGTPAWAHFNVLLPQAASAKRGEAVTLVYQWGHPYEHQLFDAPAPQGLVVLRPDGQKTDLTKALEKITVPAGGQKTVTAYEVRFTPDQRGDYLFLLNTPAIWMEEDQEFLQDTVKVVLHVQAQKGWDGVAGAPLEMVPLTRPYGLQPGLVFQAQALADAKPLAGTLVEIEHYNPATPKLLPPDEHITRTARTDPNGVVTATLTDPGWWCLTAQRDGGQREHNGKMYPVRRRTTFWVFVDGTIRFTETKDAGTP
jgi:cobalt/nickel transport protein